MEKIPILDLSTEIRSERSQLIEAFERVLDSGQFILGPEVTGLEEQISAYCGVKHGIGVNSGTDALVIALRSLNLQPNDEVITTPFTFFATAESIHQAGGKTVFADIDETTMNIDPQKVAEKITPKTRAIVAVHLFGLPAPMTELRELCNQHGLTLIEDAAQAFGATQNGVKVGNLGDICAFSFFPSKNLGGFGDGGMIVSQDDRVAELSRALRAHGGMRKYHNEMWGYNSRLDSLQAALIGVKFKTIDTKNLQRQKAANFYTKSLTGLPIKLPFVSDNTTHVFHQYCIRLPRRDSIRVFLAERGISTMVYYPVPVHQLPVLNSSESFPISEKAAEEVLALPIWPGIPEAIQEEVVKTLKEVLQSE